MQKTNAIRILEKRNIGFEVLSYSAEDGKISGVEVAEKIGVPFDDMFKTLVCEGKEKHYVFLVPVHKELDTRKAAAVTKEKSIEMVSQKTLLPLTGYIHGGCSPIGMKKLFGTWIDISAQEKERIVVSAGKVGVQIKVSSKELALVTEASFALIIK